MRKVYGDLHIHVGSAAGKPVKITASRRLVVQQVLAVDAPSKGLQMVGLVDAGSLLVSAELANLVNNGDLIEQSGGGYLARNGVLLIPGCEVESREGVHLILYLPHLGSVERYQKYMRNRVKNLTLSTQKAAVSAPELLNLACLLEGVFCPAHAFTPHKGIYGACTARLATVFGRDLGQIRSLELGLSADSQMADMISETRSFTFLSNSDAHSSPNVGREYNLFRMAEKNFTEFRYCLENEGERRVLGNFGMDPRLGKYHRTYCSACDWIIDEPQPVLDCPRCGTDKVVTGVWDRVVSIGDSYEPRRPVGRPPYHYRVPLRDLPGVGPRLIEKMLGYFGNEISVLEEASIDDLARLAGEPVAKMIAKMRRGRLDIVPGGGGKYGKVQKNNCDI